MIRFSPPGGRLTASLGLALAVGVGIGLRLLEWPAWQQAAVRYAGQPILPSFDAYGWLAGARCVGHLAAEPLALILRALTAILPVPLESIAFFLPVLLSGLAAWPMFVLTRGLGAPEAGLGAALCVILAPAYVYRTRLGYLDTDMLLLPLACVAVCGLALWRHRSPHPAQGQPTGPAVTDWSWLPPAVALAGLNWLHPGFRPVAAAMGLLFFASAWPVARADRAALASSLAIVLTALAGPWGLLAGWPISRLAGIKPGRRQAGPGPWPWIFLAITLAALAWTLPEIVDRARRSMQFFLRPEAAIPSMDPHAVRGAAESVLEAQTPDWSEIVRQSAFHWSLGLVAALAYVATLVRRPRLLPSLPLAALAGLAPLLGIRFAMYGGIVTGLGLPLTLAWAWKRIRGRERLAWLPQGVLIILIVGLSWRDAQTFFPVPSITPPHAAALTRLDSLAAPDAQIWTWWDYGYAAEFLAGRPSFADPGNNAGAVLGLVSQTLAAQTPEAAAAAMTEGASGQPSPPPPSLASRLTCPGGVVTNAPFPDGGLPRTAPRPGVALPEQYLVVSWEGLRVGRWPLWFAADGPRAPGDQPTWPMLAVAPKRINIDAGWVELEEGVFALSQLDIFQATGAHTQRSWPRDKGLAAVLNLGNAELLLFDHTARQAMLARLLIDRQPDAADGFELVVDHAPWVRIYRLRTIP